MNTARRITSIVTLLAAVLVVASPGLAAASALEDRLEAELRGAWCVLATEVYSGCAEAYTDNRVGAGVTSRGAHRFAAGEVARIDKLKLKRARVDLFVTLAEPILVSRVDGPFTLFDEHRCQAQLIFELPREVVKGRDPGPILERIDAALTTYRTLEKAKASGEWNGRVRDPYPPDYQATLARYAVWKAEQVNTAVAARVAEELEAARRVLDHVNRNPAYLDGLADGIDAMRDWGEHDCDDLINARFGARERRAPSEHRGGTADDRSWRDGYRDGQQLAFSTILARRLDACYVPVPILEGGP